LLGATADEIAITHHTTERMNIAIWGPNWQPGDEIITTTEECDGALLPDRQGRADGRGRRVSEGLRWLEQDVAARLDRFFQQR